MEGLTEDKSRKHISCLPQLHSKNEFPKLPHPPLSTVKTSYGFDRFLNPSDNCKYYKLQMAKACQYVKDLRNLRPTSVPCSSWLKISAKLPTA